MSYYSLSQIENQITVRQPLSENRNRKYLDRKRTVFLSHSHKDADIIEKVIAFLLSMGIYVYVDWLDPAMPEVTSAETASKIKTKILECERFIVLLTENSKESKWVPWELGFADGKKPIENIAILPIKRSSNTPDSTFKGLEYFGLYPVISIGDLNGKSVPAIFPPERLGGKGQLLNEGWLKREKVIFG